MKSIKYLLSVLLIGICFILWTEVVSAQEAGISVSPSLSEVILQPGATVTISYSLENLKDPTVLSLSVLPFTPSDSFGNISLKQRYDGPIRFTIAEKEMELNKLFFLKSTERKKINLQLRAPDGTPEGDYYYSFISQTEAPPAQDAGTVVRSEISIASPILISVKKSLHSPEKAKIVLFDIISKKTITVFGQKIQIVESTQPFQAILTVQNNSNYFTKAQGRIILRNLFGKVTTYSVAPQNILAHWQRTLLSENHGNTTSLDTNTFLLGPYTLQADIELSKGSTKLTESISFIALPIKHLLWGTLCVLIVFSLFKYFLKKRQ